MDASVMTNAVDECKTKCFALMARYKELGRLLPDPDDLDTDDAAPVAEAKVSASRLTFGFQPVQKMPTIHVSQSSSGEIRV